jgi:hypothetical protein
LGGVGEFDPEGRALPWEEGFDGLWILAGEGFEGGFWSDEGGVESVFRGAFVAAISEKAKAVLVIRDGFLSCAAEELWPFGLWDGEGIASGGLKSFEPTAAEISRFSVPVLVEAMGRIEEGIVVQDVERGAVDGLSLGFAPVPKGAEDGHAALREVGVARDAPERIGVAFANDGGVADEPITRLVEPVGATEFGQLLFELVGEREQMCGVIDRVIEHLSRKRTDCPVGLLGGFGEDEAEVVVEQSGEAELTEADESRSDARVEDIFRIAPARFSEQSQVIVAPVDDHGFAFENGEEGGEVERGEGVDEEVGFWGGDLDEAEFFEVAVQGIRFRIERDSGVLCEVLAESEEGGLFSDHFRGDGRSV